ncbi:MAG: carboxymuconolactone decarboxylase family protein [Acetobacteraceae bacterium]|nr:carboxymuconolactone decarboxylase family protein [Acetobacteraceae bacterium]MBY0363535.1 carboxymuconolactone decarboxylase family protein [Phreatobacter sp.]
MTIAFTRHTRDTAPAASQPILDGVKSTFGFVPSLQATMAESPQLLAGYSALWDLVHNSSLTPTEQQVVYMTANFENECHYCMAGHTTLARMQKIAEPTIAALRDGTAIPDAKLEALHAFATAVVRDRGHVADAQVQAFLDAGYTRQSVLDVVLVVATKVMSNYTNHLTATPLDAFMKGNEWSKPVARAA